MLAKWDVVGTIIAPGGGNEAVWCDDPQAVLALVEEVLAPFGARALRAPEQMAA